MAQLSGVPVIQFRHPTEKTLAGIETVVPYRIGAELAATLQSYRDAAATQAEDWEALRQELGALEIRPHRKNDYEGFRLFVKLPATQLAYDLAMKSDNRISDDPRLTPYVAPYYSCADFMPDEETGAAWWMLYKNEISEICPNATEENSPSQLLYEKARHIHFADNWQEQFWRDYDYALRQGLSTLRHPERPEFQRFMYVGEVPLHHLTYSQIEEPRTQIAEEAGILLVPRFCIWEIDPEKSDINGCHSKGKQPVAVSLQPDGAEPITYEEAFMILRDAGLHDDIYSLGRMSTEENWAEFNPVNADLNLTPRYQYLHLSPEREQVIADVIAVQDIYEAKYQATLAECGAEKFGINEYGPRVSDGRKALQALVTVDGDSWRPGWKPQSRTYKAGEKGWWEIHPANDHLDAELTAYLRQHFASHPGTLYFDALKQEIAEAVVPAISNLAGEERSADNIVRTINRIHERWPHLLGDSEVTILAYPSIVFEGVDCHSLTITHWQHPEYFQSKPKMEYDRMAVFLKNMQALTYAEAGAILEAQEILPPAAQLKASRPGDPIILDKNRLER